MFNQQQQRPRQPQQRCFPRSVRKRHDHPARNNRIFFLFCCCCFCFLVVVTVMHHFGAPSSTMFVSASTIHALPPFACCSHPACWGRAVTGRGQHATAVFAGSHHRAMMIGGGALSSSSSSLVALEAMSSSLRSILIKLFAITRFLERRPMLVLGAVVAHRYVTTRVRITPWTAALVEGDPIDNNPQDDTIGEHSDRDERTTTNEHSKEKEEETRPVMTTAMISSIRFYKMFISPLLPPACRFVPTCSMYGVQAIQEFGPSKGAVLTAWRILRCSPFGGKGYDPPKWPPVPYWYSSY